MLAVMTRETSESCFVPSLCAESGELLESLGEHSSSIKGLSLHPNGRYVLAVTACNAILWDLDTFSKCRTLNGGQDVGVQDVCVHMSVGGTHVCCVSWGIFIYMGG